MPATVTGESPLDRQLWLYRELYGLPCRLSGTRITLSTSDITAIRIPGALAAHVDDELFWLEKVTPILDEHPGTGVLTLLAAPTHLDLTFPATDFRRRAHCEFLPPERELILPAPRTPYCLGPRWFRYPQWETLQPVTTVLRAIRVALHTYPA
ncbi:hypothetical protein KHQ06_31985 [Nocardia tengchongensis]|uniref:Uncharacterized protein n=1 Tax=Nocardia tengchongensis TaxID=2055889 RepID=A0ABX8CL93_9NOCA|nr:hypothetical protein [Nocardia tengchongensis]QVI20690.1 hypothetical protein KHQ06_31985 [Nocardia tengchongensis]